MNDEKCSKYYQKYLKNPENDPWYIEDAFVTSWENCKEEVLKILENNPRCDDYYYDLKEKIEKL